MSLAALFNVPDEEKDFLMLSFSNMDEHRQIVDAIRTQKGVELPLYPLDPMPLHDLAAWANIHQAAHNDFCRVLGIAGVDLTSVDLKDQAQVASWVRLHGSEHQQAAALLGIT